jgi:cellobiose phosphorylase
VPVSFDTDKESFMGMYGHQSMPAGILEKKLAKKKGNWLDHVASLQHLVKLKPNGEQTIHFTLGCADSKEQAVTLAKKYQSAANVDAAFTAMQARWKSLLTTVEVSTPDDAMNAMENIWLKYQAISGRIWGRTAYYQTGGAYGFRDQLQDSQVWLPIDPVRTKNQLQLHARHQFKDGTVYHWWHPMSEVGMRNQIMDNLLWMPFVMNAYLQETNDLSILDDVQPFVDDAAAVPMYVHCYKAIDKSLERFSERGLPLIGSGDWNDGLSAVGLDMKGESIWLGHFIHRILVDFAAIAKKKNDPVRCDRYIARAAELRSKLNTIGWDGEYYFGATKDSGEKIGSKSNTEGSVWLNPQTWAIIAGVSDPARSEQVLDVVEQKLEKEIGPLLLFPAYKTPDKFVGYLTRYSPGMRENGGVYTHGATWSVIAAAMLGRGETAFRFYNKLNPVFRGKNPDKYVAEPYVTPGNIEGPDSDYYGRGGWTWYSGSAAWLFKVGLEWILGIRAGENGLLVDPCIPASWKGFTVKRQFRGAVYSIEVLNPNNVQCGVKELWVNGELTSKGSSSRQKTIPVLEAGKNHSIVAILG